MNERAAVDEADLGKRFDIRAESFEHGEFEVDLLLPVSSDDLIDVSEFNTDERLPYWAELWPSARALARELLEAPELPGRALELGCGVGLPSLAVRSRGVDVLATDYYEDALLFTRVNAARNGLAGITVRSLDWRRVPDDQPRFPLVLGADLLYEGRNAESLAAALPRVVAPSGEAWIADPGRVYLSTFLDRIRSLGWTVAEDRERVEPNHADETRPHRIRLLRLRNGDPA